jgi:ribonuclease HI
VLCDSQYVINSVTSWMPGWKRRGWRKADGKPVLNVELLKELDEAISGRRYRFEWVKGHVGHELNEAADERARAVATAFQRGTAIPAGPGFTPLEGGAAAPAPASSPAPDAAPASAPSLFDLADGSGGRRSVTVELAADEWGRLERRARRAGVSPEQLLRELAARA